MLLSHMDHFRLNDEIQRFLDDQDSDSVLNVGADMRKMNYCFSKLKVGYIWQYNIWIIQCFYTMLKVTAFTLFTKYLLQK